VRLKLLTNNDDVTDTLVTCWIACTHPVQDQFGLTLCNAKVAKLILINVHMVRGALITAAIKTTFRYPAMFAILPSHQQQQPRLPQLKSESLTPVTFQVNMTKHRGDLFTKIEVPLLFPSFPLFFLYPSLLHPRLIHKSS